MVRKRDEGSYLRKGKGRQVDDRLTKRKGTI
jgi:hypothetical protein